MDFPNHIKKRAVHHLCAICLQVYLLNCFSNNYNNFFGEYSILTEQKMELKFYPSCFPLHTHCAAAASTWIAERNGSVSMQ